VEWAVCSPETVVICGGAYFFGTKSITIEVPSDVTSAYGASTYQAWMSRESCGQSGTETVSDKYDQSKSASHGPVNQAKTLTPGKNGL